jgi:hypothetical protein
MPPERGGPTTQSGILYQNSVAAIYLGQLIDMAACPDVDRVSELRVEAPEHVDDIVVTYADGHKVYIQGKEDIQVNDAAWIKLWSDFQQQYSVAPFVRGRDQLLLQVGTAHERHHQLKGACERASTSHDYAEWQSRLTQEQKVLLNGIKGLLDPELTEDENLLTFFKHVRVEIWPSWLIDTDLVRYRIPPSNTTQNTLFRLLRDRAGGEARVRGTFTASTLAEQLQQENGVNLVAPPNLNDLRSAVSACGDLLRQQRTTVGATGLHIDRTIVDEIVAWVLSEENKGDKERVALLLDRAGIGKTVALCDVMQRVEGTGVPVLAIKADLQLSGVASYDELQQRLQFPEPVVRAVNRLAAEGRVLVLRAFAALFAVPIKPGGLRCFASPIPISSAIAPAA